MIRPEEKKYSIPEPCGCMGDSITVEELAARVNCKPKINFATDSMSRILSGGSPLPWLLTFSCNGEELIIARGSIDAIVRTAPGSQARAGISVSGKVFYVDDEYETVKEKVFGVRA